ncbi:MAG: hypothetical protein ACQETH_00345 [Candidatus Rifleibacteriota bacterium]
MRLDNLIKIFFVFLFLLVASTSYCQKVASFSDFSDISSILDDTKKGVGKVAITLESFAGKNVKRVSQLAQRAEIWLGNKRLATLFDDSASVIKEKRRILFSFRPIRLPVGYYSLTARLYRRGSFYAREKHHDVNFQVGIHPGKIVKIYKSIPFFVW